MPWKETCAMFERCQFVIEVQKGEESFAVLCRRYGITRKIGYKWMVRFEEHGLEGLADQSRAPRHHPNAVSAELEERVVELRERHPRYGPRKLRVLLQREYPSASLPCASTISKILGERGLIPDRRRTRRTPLYAAPFAPCAHPNDTWCIDFKGWFHTGNGRRCYPLTITDQFSRFLLRCQALPGQQEVHVRFHMEWLFRQYGLPDVIRSDNGTPFASRALGALSTLSVWWMKLGIRPERSRPATPSDNGRHERMHLTLKQHTAMPPQASLRQQQMAFERFQEEYNYERPHEALHMSTPAEYYAPSLRPYPDRIPEPQYPNAFPVRRVEKSGQIRFQGKHYFLTRVLAGETVGLEPDDADERWWGIHFGPDHIGWLYLPKPHALDLKQRRGTNQT